MADLTLRDVRKSYGGMEILHGIDLDIASGEFVVFVGPSGCGKSTLLRCIAGLEDITSGEMHIASERMNEVSPSRRGIAMVFQSYALYPHMSVYDNMAFSLKIAGEKKVEIDRRVRQAAERLQLTAYLDRVPKALSGGQRQRVAIGRAIVRNPKVFLFDEPLSNLDAALRVATRIEIAKLKESMPGTTMIYVTHDQVEAMTLADRIVVLKDGKVEQIGTPIELYRRPANLFVAQFIGSPAMNILPATCEANGEGMLVRHAAGGAVHMAMTPPTGPAGGEICLGVRPEDLFVAAGTDGLFEGRVDLVEQLGEVQLVYLDIGRGAPLIAKLPGNQEVARGSHLRLDVRPGHLHLFSKEGHSIARRETS
ncbi:sn-glycerol-3-phosphate ABC transporter ATP-binding protein UgpC [Bosea sp. 117]|uniref:ABC transporter ATP-binding protein n=1 Tax=Bosea sp. 117 TaxID=1125973 RepID=UPI0004943D9A|nr:sn-glycerol-3-phosphate ABC transporter ATP-binding protein UgpC [Bosea sp. 117]